MVTNLNESVKRLDWFDFHLSAAFLLIRQATAMTSPEARLHTGTQSNDSTDCDNLFSKSSRCSWKHRENHTQITQQIKQQALTQCCFNDATVVDGGPSLKQHWVTRSMSLYVAREVGECMPQIAYMCGPLRRTFISLEL